jgi:hypothetical protein
MMDMDEIKKIMNSAFDALKFSPPVRRIVLFAIMPLIACFVIAWVIALLTHIRFSVIFLILLAIVGVSVYLQADQE